MPNGLRYSLLATLSASYWSINQLIFVNLVLEVEVKHFNFCIITKLKPSIWSFLVHSFSNFSDKTLTSPLFFFFPFSFFWGTEMWSCKDVPKNLWWELGLDEREAYWNGDLAIWRYRLRDMIIINWHTFFLFCIFPFTILVYFCFHYLCLCHVWG